MYDWLMSLLYQPKDSKGIRKSKYPNNPLTSAKDYLYGPSEEAIDWSFKQFPKGSSAEGDERDVARHLMGAALTSQRIGKYPAIAAGLGREFFTLNNLYDTEEGWNDHHNNIVGADLGQKAKSREELERMILEYIANAQRGTAPVFGGTDKAYYSGIPNKKTIYDH
jgi:hypothetical protein